MKEILCRTPRSMAMIEPHGNVVANRISSGGNFRDKGISYDQTGSTYCKCLTLNFTLEVMLCSLVRSKHSFGP